ncbi:oxidoreductase [Candidatus Roizmanbacteria bacterium RIFCSPHIGHO2_01_FULL_39_12c]|uniref:Oxidoreductase n=1 Tax=Candidatus Roizmanbacteria bacterium RIFCSPHIGHO2_01_FULL_39_12c TaxID=1802031 RepID=A0A1F7GDZ4_9BACT|nr:MAG: oxidoreductase [Candidatus Roizmanbacteria bacterium RIFCSPHIGHO2_01_FULL_39_12c]OGK48141.1 MAG: oxidoreductase [Candidatus Roizmanbacteria bacterium RIFCSPLOWO2_01_FULL_40_13]
MIKIGVIGYGYWGPNLVRNFFGNNDCKIIKVADTKPERLFLLKKHYPAIKAVNQADEILNDRSIEAVVVATPVATHFPLGKKTLESGKHLLLEKPMASSLFEAEKLVELAKKKKKVLMVDHTFVYKDAVRKIKQMIDERIVGKLRYLDSTRTNLGLFQPDVNVLWDLAAHDVSILLYLQKEKPLSIQASGVSHTGNKIENLAYLTLKYRSGFVAHFNVSWISPVKIRMMLIGGSKKMVVFNDVEPSEKIRIYDSRYRVRDNKDKNKFIVDYRMGDIHIPKIDLKEALSDMASDFIESIKTGKRPVADMEHGLEVVKILSLAQQSLNNGEKPVYYK